MFVRYQTIQALKVQRQQYFDVILTLSDVVSHGAVLLVEEASNNTMLYDEKGKVKEYYSVYSNLSCLYKSYQAIIISYSSGKSCRLSGK